MTLAYLSILLGAALVLLKVCDKQHVSERSPPVVHAIDCGRTLHAACREL